MNPIQLTIMVMLLHLFSIGQNQTTESIVSSTDSLIASLAQNNATYFDSTTFNQAKIGIGKKLITGSLIASEYNLFIGTSLAVGPETVSKWEDKMEKLKFKALARQYIKSFTTAPVIDKDLFIINYIGHPYQGSFYYNALRSQNACALHSAFFSFGHSLIWEYVWEAGLEQPSIQDLITTPVGGILVGELSHRATLKMSQNGFRWYEVVLVYIINPAYVINKGFKLERPTEK